MKDEFKVGEQVLIAPDFSNDGFESFNAVVTGVDGELVSVKGADGEVSEWMSGNVRKLKVQNLEVITVLVVRNGIHDESFCFCGTLEVIKLPAERKFVELCKYHDDDYADLNTDVHLENGYYEFRGGHVFITHSDVINFCT